MRLSYALCGVGVATWIKPLDRAVPFHWGRLDVCIWSAAGIGLDVGARLWTVLCSCGRMRVETVSVRVALSIWFKMFLQGTYFWWGKLFIFVSTWHECARRDTFRVARNNFPYYILAFAPVSHLFPGLVSPRRNLLPIACLFGSRSSEAFMREESTENISSVWSLIFFFGWNPGYFRGPSQFAEICKSTGCNCSNKHTKDHSSPLSHFPLGKWWKSREMHGRSNRQLSACLC